MADTRDIRAARRTPAMRPVRSAPPLHDSLGAASVLVVEDQMVVALHIAHSLERLGYRIAGRARNAEDAVRLAAELAPDVVLMDIHLEGALDGVEAARRIRAEVDIPIVFLTAFADPATVERAVASSPFGYVVKPFRPGELRATIEIARTRHASERRVRSREARAHDLLATDELTQLLNRRGFAEMGEQEVARAARDGTPLLLFFVDLDEFKQINDTLGHAAGDEALRAAADILSGVFRKPDLVARLGGDEFAALAVGATAEAAAPIKARIAAAVDRFNGSGAPFRLEMSVGVAAHDPSAGEGFADLLLRADFEMYRHKRVRRSNRP